MFDHVLLDLVNALKGSLTTSMLESPISDERLQFDVWAGDLTFETTYTLPGEEDPPRVRADISIEWSTWCQSAYRSWTLGEGLDEPLEVDIEIALRLSGLAQELNIEELSRQLPPRSPDLFESAFDLTGGSCERNFDVASGQSDFTAEFDFEAIVRIEEEHLNDHSAFDVQFAPIGQWLTTMLVRLSDLEITYVPPDDHGDEEA
jgi:hypothetical protein